MNQVVVLYLDPDGGKWSDTCGSLTVKTILNPLAQTSHWCGDWRSDFGPECDKVFVPRAFDFQTSGCVRPGKFDH